MRLQLTWISLAVVSIALIACGGDGYSASTTASSPTPSEQSDRAARDAGATPTAAPSEDSLAASMLPTLADFPTGWVHRPASPDEDLAVAGPEPIRACFQPELTGLTGTAVGGEFSDSNTTRLSINPSVYVFNNETNAEQAVQTIAARAQCFADTIGDGLDVDESFAFGPTYTEALNAGDFGAKSAVRLFDTQIYKDQNPVRSDVLVFDIIIVAEGRVLYQLEGFQRHTAIDQALLKRYVDEAAARIRQQ